MNNDLAIVIIGYDGYSDMWDDCVNLLKDFWQDCPYEIVFVNNTKDVSWENVTVLHAGDNAEWSKKVQTAIEYCKTEYICLLLEDFFVGKTISTEQVKETLLLIKREKIKYFKLVNLSRAVKNRDPKYKSYDFLHIIPENDDYGVSLQAAIWQKDYLDELVGKENYNAWKFEFARVKEANENSTAAKEGCVFDERNILNLKHGVLQSEYIPATVKYFKKINKPLNVQRKVMSKGKYIKSRCISKVKYLIPIKQRKKVKKVLEKCGMKFVSTKRDN